MVSSSSPRGKLLRFSWHLLHLPCCSGYYPAVCCLLYTDCSPVTFSLCCLLYTDCSLVTFSLCCLLYTDYSLVTSSLLCTTHVCVSGTTINSEVSTVPWSLWQHGFPVAGLWLWRASSMLLQVLNTLCVLIVMRVVNFDCDMS